MSSSRATRSRVHKPSPASMSSGSSKRAPDTLAKSCSKITSPSQPPSVMSRKKSSRRGKIQRVHDVWCICRGPDDRTPMIKCESCKDWFHFTCIGLSDCDAEDIQLYICAACHDKTGQSTVYEWEGSDAVEEDLEGGTCNLASNKTSVTENEKDVVPDDDDDDGAADEEASEDDYQEEERQGTMGVRRVRGTQIITSSDDEDPWLGGEHSRGAPSRRSQLKRKRGRELHSVPRKRHRKPSSDVSDNQDTNNKHSNQTHPRLTKEEHSVPLDPTRKYCLGKLREVLVPIFVQFASTQRKQSFTTGNDEEIQKRAEDDGAAYVQDLEQCLFETYGELDKRGHKSAAGKYKDRFRMLSFNLSQPDRHLLRRNIGTHTLSASQLSKMSSVELANEQTKLQIEAANRESLEHSILKQRPIAARAKITHKGEEIIEDLVGDDVGRRIREEEQRETEREREREKEASEKIKMPPPPLSQKEKIVYQGPQDILAQQHNAASQKAQAQAQVLRPKLPTASSSSAELPPEPVFKFDDLIAIDLPESSPSLEVTTDETGVSVAAPPPANMNANIPPSPVPQTGVSRSSKSRPASFDLNNVWSGSPSENATSARSGSPIPSRQDDTREVPTIDIDFGTAADDEDFDMFLDQTEGLAAASDPTGPEEEWAAFEALPVVWSGHLNVPDAGKSPPVQARQVGGRSIDLLSDQWRILFPSQPANQLKVDGRVPVKDSATYMMRNRLNVTRELIIVALTPSSNRTDFDEIISFLVNRERHAVVHPWGPNPSPDAPGKELYLIPIMPHEALPDYIEILDLIKFPKQRDDKILLGVFVLNKEKFIERLPSRPIQPLLSPPQIAQTSGVPTTTATSLQTSASAPPIPPEIVSKLTTQQIESLLQSVLSGSMNTLPLPQSHLQQSQSPPQPPTTFSPAFPPSLATLLSQQQYPGAPYVQYPATGMTPPQQYSQAPPQQLPPIPFTYQPPPQNLPSSPSRDQDHRISPSYGNEHSRPGDWGGRRGNRGHRSFSGDRGRGSRGDFDRPRDSGWGGRGRGRGAHQSPPRPW